jgi:pimeloyl-ACP methyl ester carboxylesterase
MALQTQGQEFFSTRASVVGYCPIDDYFINYEMHGTGNTKFVFITGFMGSSGVWSSILNYFLNKDDSYSCLVVNNRGFGRSSGPKEMKRYTTSGMAQDVIKVLEYINWTEDKSINLVGKEYSQSNVQNSESVSTFSILHCR